MLKSPNDKMPSINIIYIAKNRLSVAVSKLPPLYQLKQPPPTPLQSETNLYKVDIYLCTHLSIKGGVRKGVFHHRQKISKCLNGISTRQLELLLWRAGPTALHLQDCLIFIQLNYVQISKGIQVLPPYVKLPCHMVAPGIPFPLNQ